MKATKVTVSTRISKDVLVKLEAIVEAHSKINSVSALINDILIDYVEAK
jgi:hypothetical protein